jgi:3-methyladenine DNA glycosylase/8-oxoguanine DNA glycosylase
VVKRQVELILSLDADGSAFPEVGQRDSVVGRLQARYLGLRAVCFSSPYEAAAWALIGQRIRIVQAAKIKNRMASELGPTVEVHGRSEHAFPGPKRLAALDSFPGLTARKVEYLRQLGREAAEEKFDAAYLRCLPEREALAQLEKLPGIGPFSAGFILLRGAGTLDLLPTREPRLGSAVAMAYDFDAPPNAGSATALVPAMASLQNMGKPAPASHAKAVVNEVGPPLRCLLLCVACRKLRNARHASPGLGSSIIGPISLHNAIEEETGEIGR